ncbi:MAG: hypothetical protein PWQ18_594 [Clostridia bacterium]|nr:hypothetical protein [Clostridia bacterium]
MSTRKANWLKIFFVVFMAMSMFFIMLPVSWAENGNVSQPANYTLMVYLNGTDLESKLGEDGITLAGAGSNDLDEMMAIGSQPGVLNVVVQTGGTNGWKNPNINPEINQRWLIQNNSMELVQDVGSVNMMLPDTLKDFIVWAANSYPAEKYGLILWNHGGGAHGGYGVDELFNNESLSLAEIKTALEGANKETGITFELIGFDACLMATIETAYTVSPYTRYFVGSEETEPGHGWNYTSILQSIIDNPSISGDRLGEAIARGYREQAVEWGDEDETTLSVVDVSQIDSVIAALEALVNKAGTDIDVPETYVEFARGRNKAEDYGNSGGAHGDSTDMVDIGDLAKQLENQYPEEAAQITAALNNAVVFNLDPPAKKPNASGLTVYLPCKDKQGFADKLSEYQTINFSPVYTDFVEKYGQKVTDDTTGVQLEDPNPAVEDNMEDNPPVDSGGEENPAGESDPQNNAAENDDLVLPGDAAGHERALHNNPKEDRFQIKIKESDLSRVNMIYSVLGQYYDNNTKIRFLGMDNDVGFDEKTGIVKDNFNGLWVQLGGHFVSMFLMDENDGKYNYSVPIKLNGEDMDLQIIYDAKTDTTKILGAWGGIDPVTGMSARDIIKLKAGDVITPMFYYYDIVTDKDGDVAGDPFTVQDPAKLELEADFLPPGDYLYGFYIEDIAQNETYSEFVDISLSTGDDTTPPMVTSTTPTNGAIGVPVGQTITLNFSETVQQGSSFSGVTLKDSSNTVVDFVYNLSGSILTINPVANLSNSVAYTVYLPAGAVIDQAGNPLATSYSFSFTTATAATGGSGGSGGGTSTPPVVQVEKPVQAGTTTMAEITGKVRVEVPAGAVSGTNAAIKAEVVSDEKAFSAGMTLLGKVVDVVLKNGTLTGRITITLFFDKSKLGEGQEPAVFYYDAKAGKWMRLAGTINVGKGTVTVTVDHLTIFAVFATAKEAPEPEAVTFKDTQGHWATDTVGKLAALGIVSGYPDGTFKPENEITRAEVTAILARALKLVPGKEEDLKFKDNTMIPVWARGVVAAAVGKGLVRGYPQPDGTVTFEAGRPVSRVEMAALLVRTLEGRTGTVSPAELRFADAGSIPGWARASVGAAVAKGIVAGYPDNTFRAEKPVTRAEAATMILRLLDSASLS